jgi:prepilin-type N-terminal cleavage/methylation domain-containing protein
MVQVHCRRRSRCALAGFTLVELLVVITIIAVLMGLLIPAVMQVRDRANQVTCLNNQKQLAMATMQFEQARGHYPGYVNNVRGTKTTWVPPLLPGLGRNDMWESWRDGKPVHNKLAILLCPSAELQPGIDTPMSFSVNAGYAGGDEKPANGVFLNAGKSRSQGNTAQYIDAHDGSSYTLLSAENLQTLGWQYTTDQEAKQGTGLLWHAASNPIRQINGFREAAIPKDADRADYARPSSNHFGVVLVSFCDTSCRALSSEIDYDVYKQLMTPYGKGSDDQVNKLLNEDDLR